MPRLRERRARPRGADTTPRRPRAPPAPSCPCGGCRLPPRLRRRGRRRRVRFPRHGRRRFVEERSGQMMLLAAVLLVIGFVAITGVVSRINQAGARTVQVQDNPILLEVGRLSRTVDGIIVDLLETHPEAGGDNVGFRDELCASLNYLQDLEQARGFRMTSDIHRPDGTAAPTTHVRVTLHDSATHFSFVSKKTFDFGTPSPSCLGGTP